MTGRVHEQRPVAETDEIDELVLEHRGYVRALASGIAKRLPPHVPFDDLVGYGEQGLVEAARRWRPDLGVAFTTFSYYRIRGAIFDGVGKLLGTPPGLRRRAGLLHAADDYVENELGAVDPMADETVQAERLAVMIRGLGIVFSISQLKDGEASLEAVDAREPGEQSARRELTERLQQALQTLPEPNRGVIQWIYFDGLTTLECGRKLGVDKSTISRIHRRTIGLLAAQLQEQRS